MHVIDLNGPGYGRVLFFFLFFPGLGSVTPVLYSQQPLDMGVATLTLARTKVRSSVWSGQAHSIYKPDPYPVALTLLYPVSLPPVGFLIGLQGFLCPVLAQRLSLESEETCGI